MNKLSKKKKKGFTLIELIAVIAILAILAVIAVPRVISYVDKSKKVAVQTEATTIYNAAEAAYNDGRLKTATVTGNKPTIANNAASLVTNGDFDKVKVKDAVNSLTAQDLLSNVNTSKFGAVQSSITLGELRTIMNADVNKLNVDSNGQLQSPIIKAN